MKRTPIDDRKFSERTGKLHRHCPYQEKTGINVHVVIKDGTCYKSGQCMVVECRYNNIMTDIENLISVTW